MTESRTFSKSALHEQKTKNVLQHLKMHIGGEKNISTYTQDLLK